MTKKPGAIAALGLAGLMLVLGAVLPFRITPSPARLDVPSLGEDELFAPGSGDDALSVITTLKARLQGRAESASLYAQLGRAYLQAARDEADPGHLPNAERALRRSLALEPEDNVDAYVGMAALGNARHDFSGSVDWARRAVAAEPADASAYGLLGDALFELGRVRAADRAYQQMVDVRPDVASYVRASYALQYHGETRAAIGTMKLALQAAGPSGETAAWVRHQLGDIYAGTRDFARAARQNRIGMSIAPGYVPPRVGLAEAYVARGRLGEAVDLVESATAEMAALEYMITLGELYEALGRRSLAARQNRIVEATLAVYRRAGVRVDSDFTVFYADHGLRLEAALREARVAYRERPTQKMADALAWILHASGRDREALHHANEALRGPVDDALYLFHAGVISYELGDRQDAARLMRSALDVDPTFSVTKAPIARRIAGLVER